jgi:acyl-CoA reductase-like NAD-dependent aldehyde dehydrogenase
MATAETKTSKNYIGGEWVEATGDETFDTVNPANGDLLGTFPRSSPGDVDGAVEAAREA